MPIRKENLHRYPENWREIRQRILDRAESHCETCGVRNYAVGFRRKNGAFEKLPKFVREFLGNPKPPFFIPVHPDGEQVKVIRIVLTIAHLDHTPENCSARNLKALCQRCHNRLDGPTRAKGKRDRAKAADPQLALFS